MFKTIITTIHVGFCATASLYHLGWRIGLCRKDGDSFDLLKVYKVKSKQEE